MKPIKYNEYPKDWHEYRGIWSSRISVHFSYPSSGWVLLSVLTSAFMQHDVAYLSEVYDPFWELIDWLLQIAQNDLPAKWTIDEEGHEKHFIVSQTDNPGEMGVDVEFRINAGGYEDENFPDGKETVLICRCSRLQLLEEFAKRLERWLDEDYEQLGWVGQYTMEEYPDSPHIDLRNLDLAAVKEAIAGMKKDEAAGSFS